MFKLLKTPYNTGFHMTFENGWTASVQWGPSNYIADRQCGDESVNAEIAAWDKDGKMYYFETENDQVKGWVTPDEVARFIAWVAAKEK